MGESVTDSGPALALTEGDGGANPEHPGSEFEEYDSGQASALSAGMHEDARPMSAITSRLDGSPAQSVHHKATHTGNGCQATDPLHAGPAAIGTLDYPKV